MAVANAWATGHSVVPPPQLRLSSSASAEPPNHFYKKKFSPNSLKKSLIRRSKNPMLSCRCSNNPESSKNYRDAGSNSISSYPSSSCSSPSSDWDWNRWTRHFSEIEQAENYASVLKFQLEDAIEKEDFQEAAKLKIAIAEATSKDSIAEIMSHLKDAIDEERYHDASRLCRNTGSGLVGWWVGYTRDSDDPFGRLIRITPGTGRFIGKSYSPRQLVTSSPGTPLFEIFVVKDGNEEYNIQDQISAGTASNHFECLQNFDVLQLIKEFSNRLDDVLINMCPDTCSRLHAQRQEIQDPFWFTIKKNFNTVAFLKQTKVNSETSSDKLTKGTSVETENASVVDVKLEESEAEKGEKKSIDLEGAAEEGIKSVINFLKEKIPELKVKVMRVDVAENITEDEVKQFIDEESENSTSSDSEDDTTDIDANQLDRVAAEGDSDIMEDENNLDMKLYIGGVLHSKEDGSTKDEFVRIPAQIMDIERDSFVLRVPKKYHDNDAEEDIATKVTIAAQGVSELMPPDVAKALWSSSKVSPKVSRDVREIVKLAIGQAQKRNRLSEFTNFSRVTTAAGDLDPFDGLYVGAFGPYGTEVVQLRRKYGNWNMNNDEESSDVEFFEYVEAVKLTGDLNVPAGQVTFRAKIGKGNRLANRGVFPHELGVVASYKGQGRIAEFGFRNPRWVEGELLQLSGKGLGPYVKGADLGFLYVVPEQSFLVLFNRLKLPE